MLEISSEYFINIGFANNQGFSIKSIYSKVYSSSRAGIKANGNTNKHTQYTQVLNI